jgi:hypothetical protein
MAEAVRNGKLVISIGRKLSLSQAAEAPPIKFLKNQVGKSLPFFRG